MRTGRYEARGKFGDYERCVRVARGVAEIISSLLSAFQTSQVLHIMVEKKKGFITLILKSLVVPVIWLALVDTIYSRIAPFLL